MNITYEVIFAILNSKFELIVGEEKCYFIDDSKRIVATVDENLITMFYDFPENSEEIWNHNGVAIAIVKNFNVNGQICDILCIDGLCGTCNDFIMGENFFLDTTYNIEIENYKAANKCELGNCGNLLANDGVADFDICGIKVVNAVVNKQVYDQGQDINILSFRGISQKVDYDEVYSFYRQKYDWCYDEKYDSTSSKKIRDFIEKRRFSTVDTDLIHIMIPPIVSDSIYKKVKK